MVGFRLFQQWLFCRLLWFWCVHERRWAWGPFSMPSWLLSPSISPFFFFFEDNFQEFQHHFHLHSTDSNQVFSSTYMQRGLENAVADETVLPSNDATLWKWSESESHLVGSDPWDPMDSPWNFPSQNTGAGGCSLLQGIVPTQEWNRCLLRCKWILYQLSLQESKLLKRKYQFGGKWSIFTCYKMSII